MVKYPLPGGFGKRGIGMLTAPKGEALKRLNYIQGHLEGIRKMVQEERYCVDILKQLYAVRKAVEKMEGVLLDGHLHSCVIEAIKDGNAEGVIQELEELYALSNK
jgi:DNA-binding FrmR family transcriptional regulator